MTLSAAAGALTDYAAALARRDWAGVRAVLSDDLRVVLLHTGERLGAEAFLELNRTYPGAWSFVADEVVDGGDRAVLRSHTVDGDDTWHCASFGTVDADGRLLSLTEVWSEAVTTPPDRSSR